MSAILKALRRVEGEKQERAASERLHGEVTGETPPPSPGRALQFVRVGGIGALLLAVVAAGVWLGDADPDSAASSAAPSPSTSPEPVKESPTPALAKVAVAPPSRQPTVAVVSPAAQAPAKNPLELERLSIGEYTRLHTSPTAGFPVAPEYVAPPAPVPVEPPAPEPEPPAAPERLADSPPRPAAPLLPGGAYPSRRPQAAASPAQETVSAPAPSALTGVRVLRTVWHPVAGKRVAFVAWTSEGEALELREGQAWNQWSVAEIKLSSVVFEQGDQRVVRRVGARP